MKWLENKLAGSANSLNDDLQRGQQKAVLQMTEERKEVSKQ